jgi:hypothetical protein
MKDITFYESFPTLAGFIGIFFYSLTFYITFSQFSDSSILTFFYSVNSSFDILLTSSGQYSKIVELGPSFTNVFTSSLTSFCLMCDYIHSSSI